MAVKDGSTGGKDAAYRHSGSTTRVHNDQYDGRTTDEDLSSSDGKCLAERNEWNLERVSRRGQWKDQTW